MAPVVLADSDDEAEELLDPEQIVDNEHPGAVARTGSATGNNASTTSSEELQERIRRAEADLIAPTASASRMSRQSSMPPSSTSKRRHTAVFVAEPSISPEKRVKRTKTSQKTYSKQRSSGPRADGEGAFSKFRTDDGDEPVRSSRSARFTEHSGAAASSNGLPAGSLHADFLDHQPQVLFRETGSTAVDNESSQQRMIEQARNGMKEVSTSVSKVIESDEPKSSSFPWSASVHTQSTKKAAAEEDRVAGPGDVHDDGADDDPPANGPSATNGIPYDELQTAEEGDIKQVAPVDAREEPESEVVEAEQPESSAQLPQRDLIIAPKSSPRVEITLPAARLDIEIQDATEQTERAGKGRNRKTKADESEKLSSESQAVGLPKEMYVPRPSKRRATHVVEEVIDYSMKPEKAAKARRTKTTTGSKPTGGEEAAPDDTRRQDTDAGLADKKVKQNTISPNKAATNMSAIQVDTKMQNTPVDAKTNMSASSTPQAQARKSPKAEATEDKIFVKPAMPTTSKKAKRSHTTIFEDHVDLTASQRRPSLSQQQTARKSALASIDDSTSTSKATQRRRRVIDNDDDEDEQHRDEDELALEPTSAKAHPSEARSVELEEQPTKKRRGRPPTKKASAKSAELIDEEPSGEDENVAPPSAEAEPRKCGRSRPPKKSIELVNPISEEDTIKQAEKPPKSGAEPWTPAEVSSQIPNGATSGTQEPTPSPEKRPVPGNISTPPQKSSPTSHSPIKSSSIVPLRVGLSKRQRIPSLLRVMRPPTQR
ncbi:hypothetical protein LTR78_002056 [Recurvomyces mirabilis]|uniref:Uncharacterized protein n=1 Tax=Recurvomyces mirabilis TaxID=574656 RepID=A0AAE0WU42_9PEZI|nr:hypothetical protein LTR78_002056 [Recurvomyces mirabilis]KAK5160514.1 hypothetical protein LTS14_001526 [Recurvomyces mirabilis]